MGHGNPEREKVRLSRSVAVWLPQRGPVHTAGALPLVHCRVLFRALSNLFYEIQGRDRGNGMTRQGMKAVVPGSRASSSDLLERSIWPQLNG